MSTLKAMPKQGGPTTTPLSGCVVMFVNSGVKQLITWTKMLERNGGKVIPTPAYSSSPLSWPEDVTHVVLGRPASRVPLFSSPPPATVLVVLFGWLIDSDKRKTRQLEASYLGLLPPPAEVASEAPPAKKQRTTLALEGENVTLKPLMPVLQKPVKLQKPQKNKGYLFKDQFKASVATKYIGSGTLGSSTDIYEKCYGTKLANTREYCAEDVVFVSINGKRKEREPLREAEVNIAIKAGVVFVADCFKWRNVSYNVGERELEEHLKQNDYVELGDTGTWVARSGIERYLQEHKQFLTDGAVWESLDLWLRAEQLID